MLGFKRQVVVLKTIQQLHQIIGCTPSNVKALPTTHCKSIQVAFNAYNYYSFSNTAASYAS